MPTGDCPDMSEMNPYRTPQAAVLEDDETEGNLAPEPNTVDVARSLAWLAEGWALFRQAPLVWIAICVLTLVAFMILAVIPVVGQLLTMLLSVLYAGGIMMGCRALDRGEDLVVGHLIAGFQRHFAPLLTIGALYLGGLFLVGVTVGLVTGGTFFGLIQGGLEPGVAVASVLLFLLAAAVIIVPLGMAVWFAPALAALHDVPPVAAMKSSFRGCLRNWLPFLVYGVIAFVLMVIATIPFMLGWLVLLPVLAGSIYAGYKDIFLQA